MELNNNCTHVSEESEESALNSALSLLQEDPGALYREPILSQLQKIYRQRPDEFERIRAKVKDSKLVSIARFDKLASSGNADTNGSVTSLFPVEEPWLLPVDGVALLDEIEQLLGNYVIADHSTLAAATLWIAFTWFIDAVNIAPIANITAPEKRCGKSVLLAAIGRLANRPLQTSNISTAALFRAINEWAPTLLIDEVDAFLRDNEEARGILNAGFERELAFVIRCEGDLHEPTRFNVWGAKVLCGIGKIQSTLEDRSITLRLRRKLPGEKVYPLRRSDPETWTVLRQKLARLRLDIMDIVSKCTPAQIDGLHDRANDCWEPLLQLADSVGGSWPQKARQAATRISGADEASPSIGAELLDDIAKVFQQKNTDKLFTAELLLALTLDSDSRWATWNRGKPLSSQQLANKLSDYRIRPNTVRKDTVTKKGYKLSQFNEAFERYLQLGSEDPSVTPSHVSRPAPSIDLTDQSEARNVLSPIAPELPDSMCSDDVTAEVSFI